jgi:hypothetical protein
MRNINLSGILMLSFVSIIMMASCKSDRTGQSTREALKEESSQTMERIEKIYKVYNLCPSPAEMLSFINVNDIRYNGGLLNPAARRDNYLNLKSQTLNLGIYITDLAYTSLFGRYEETIDYLEAVRDITGELKISGAINKELIGRAKENVQSTDSLFSISSEAFMNLLLFCEKNNRAATVFMISAGAFVESLYLAFNIVDKYDTSNYIIQYVTEQKYAIDNLIASAKNLPEDPNLSEVIQQLKPVLDIYNRIEFTGGNIKVRKEGSNKLVIGGGKKKLLSGEEFDELKEAISLVRNKIISNNI